MLKFCMRIMSFAILICLMTASAQAATDYTGWWWDSANSGTGYSLEVQCDKAYLVWYLYEEGGLNTWYSAILDVDGDTMTGDLYKYDGWPLEPGYDGSNTTADENLGTVALSFSDENDGIITYAPAGGGNVIRVLERRMIGDSDPRNLDGWWWDTSQQGIGWFFEAKDDVVNGDVLSVGWYNYRADATRAGGDPRFFITWAEFAPSDTTYSADLFDTMGGQTLTGDYSEPTLSVYDTLNLNIASDFDGDADGATLSFTLGGNTYNLTRFEIPGKTCNNGGDCDPEIQDYSPRGSVDYLTVPISITINSPCGTEIDQSSITMLVNKKPVSPSITGGGSTVTVSVTKDLPGNGDSVVSISASDVNGNSVEFSWEFWVPYIY